jgi:hypothetical protein
VFQSIVVVLERAACVVWGININALDLADEFLFERFEGKEIVAKDKPVIENVAVRNPMLGVIRLL